VLKPPMECVECGRSGCAKCDHTNVERRVMIQRHREPSLGANTGRAIAESPYLVCRCRCCGDIWRYDLPMGVRSEAFAPLSS
jgi:hypothetical protein